MKKITIAIDGFSSTGKSTIAKQLAEALGYVYVDTGAMYRAITLYALQHGFIGPDHQDSEALIADLSNIKLAFQFNPALGFSEMYLNNVNVEKEIRTLEVSQFVSKVAVLEEVRQKLVELQQEIGKNKAIVMDGRDIGTVVFPKAELKIFMTAAPEIRANRRYKELISRGEKVSYKDVLRNVQERDYIDSHREFSPLKKAEDAIEFDNSTMSASEQFERICALADSYIKEQ